MAFTLAIAQCVHPVPDSPEAVAADVERYAVRAAEAGASLLAFPESLMTSYEKERGAFIAEAQPLDGPFARAVNAVAAEHGLWIAYTVNELNPAGKPFNTAVIVDAAGAKRGAYRKTHLFDTDFTRESDRMAAGDALFEPVAAPFARLGLAICYDLRFPEVARREALGGAQLMLYPAAWVDGEGKADQWRTLLRARAIENEMFVAGVCRADAGYIGRSCVVDPRGRVIAEAGAGEELLFAQVDLGAIDEVRAAMPVFDHRRPELY